MRAYGQLYGDAPARAKRDQMSTEMLTILLLLAGGLLVLGGIAGIALTGSAVWVLAVGAGTVVFIVTLVNLFIYLFQNY